MHVTLIWYPLAAVAAGPEVLRQPRMTTARVIVLFRMRDTVARPERARNSKQGQALGATIGHETITLSGCNASGPGRF